MDDDSAAFVDSLLAPEMRAAAAVANPLGSLPFELPTPPTSSSGGRFAMTPRLAETLLGRHRGSHSGTDALQPAPFGDDAGLEAARSSDYDDFVFRQLMGTSSSSGGQDFDDTGSLPPASTSSARSFQMALAALASTSSKDSAVEKPPTSTNSLLFEPLELPKGGITAPLDQSFKDAFGAPASLGADSSDSPVVSPPNSMSSLRSFSSVFNVEPCSTPRSPVYSDPSAMMPVLPLSSNGQVFFTSSGMNSSSSNSSSSAGLSSTVNTSVASQPMSFWLPSSMTPTALMRGVMDSFDSATMSPPGSMKQMLLAANSGLATPPLSEGYGLAPYMMAPPNAALQTPLQMMQSGMWTPSSKVPPMQAMMQTPSAIKIESNTARRGKKRSRSRLSVSASNQNPSSLPTMTPTNDASKQLVVSADVNASFKKSEASAGSSRAAKRACNSRVRSPSTVSPMASRAPMLSPTSSDAATVSGSGSDGDNAPSTKALKGKKCVEAGCTRRAQSNSRCKAHGGGARCQYAGPGGCSRSSQGGGFCRAHGGGKRCEYPGCVRGQQRKGRCFVHGGIRRCQWAGCEKKDRGNGFCISHGGGKRCQREGCARAVRRGNLCQLHDTHGPE